MLVTLDASFRFKRSSCSFESFFCVINSFMRSISLYNYDLYRSTFFVHSRAISVVRCRPTSAVRCRPTSVVRCCPTSVVCCHLTNNILLRWMTLLRCCDLCADVTIVLPAAAACRDSPLPRNRDMTSCKDFFLECWNLCLAAPILIITNPFASKLITP